MSVVSIPAGDNILTVAMAVYFLLPLRHLVRLDRRSKSVAG